MPVESLASWRGRLPIATKRPLAIPAGCDGPFRGRQDPRQTAHLFPRPWRDHSAVVAKPSCC